MAVDISLKTPVPDRGRSTVDVPAPVSGGSGVSPAGNTTASLPAGSSPAPRTEALPVESGTVSVSAQSVAGAVEQLNSNPILQDRNLQFQVNEDADLTVIFVQDRETGDTLRQIPAKEIVTLAEKLHEIFKQGEQQNLDGDRDVGRLAGQLLDLQV